MWGDCMNRKEIIGRNLAGLRAANSLSVGSLSALADVPSVVIRSLEDGEILPSWDTVTCLCSALDCSYLELLFGEDEIRDDYYL